MTARGRRSSRTASSWSRGRSWTPASAKSRSPAGPGPTPARTAGCCSRNARGGRRTSSSSTCSTERGLAEDDGQAALERPCEGVADAALLEALDELGEEALDDQAGGDVVGEAAGAQVEELLGIDLGDGRGVGAADVVG